MTEERVKEIIKSFAYGMTAEEVAEVEGMTTEEAQLLETEHAEEITAKKEELKGGGWIE